jgi:hypothetical protein
VTLSSNAITPCPLALSRRLPASTPTPTGTARTISHGHPDPDGGGRSLSGWGTFAFVGLLAMVAFAVLRRVI